MLKYRPIKLANQMLYGEGSSIIITGWTLAKAVQKRLAPKDYAAIGQLYSAANGISPLIRNVLANKGFTSLILLDATKEDKNAGSVRCLRDFFLNGYEQGETDTGLPCWVISSGVAGYIDLEIPSTALDWVRETMKVHYVQSLEELSQLCANMSPIEVQDVEPEIYPAAAVPECPMYPGNLYGHVIRGETVASSWVKILNRIRTTGQLRPNGYGGQWQELIDLMVVVNDEPREFYFPEPNYLPVDREFIKGYLGQILDDAPVREGVKYTYGQRLRSWFGFDQIEQVIDKISSEIDTASAVMTLWDVNDHVRGGSPCLNHIWVRVNGDRLTLTASFRSNDMFSAWPANAMGLRALQFHVTDELNKRNNWKLTAGELITHSMSAHIYDNCFPTCDSMRAKIKSPRTFEDTAGNYIVSNEMGQVKVEWTTPGTGSLVKVYRGKGVKVLNEITADAPYIEPSHAAYLGYEIAMAEMKGQEYRQR